MTALSTSIPNAFPKIELHSMFSHNETGKRSATPWGHGHFPPGDDSDGWDGAPFPWTGPLVSERPLPLFDPEDPELPASWQNGKHGRTWHGVRHDAILF